MGGCKRGRDYLEATDVSDIYSTTPSSGIIARIAEKGTVLRLSFKFS